MRSIMHRHVVQVVGVLALGLALLASIGTPQHAFALPIEGSGYASCTYGGDSYSHGSVIKQADGNYYKCEDGQWRLDKSGTAVASNDGSGQVIMGPASDFPMLSIGGESAVAPGGEVQVVLGP